MNEQPGGPIGLWKVEVLGGRRESTVHTHLEDLLKRKILIKALSGTLGKVLWDCTFKVRVMP